MSEYLKIPVVLGVNDNPIPPNYNGNRRGCNGSYVVDRHNKLVDVVRGFVQVSDTDPVITFTIANMPSYLDLGEPLTTLSTPLLLSYSVKESLDVYAQYFDGDSIESLTPLTSINHPPNNIYELLYPDIVNQPNTYLVPHTRILGAKFYEAASEILFPSLSSYKEIHWKPRTIIGLSPLSSLTSLSDLNTILFEDFVFNDGDSITKPTTPDSLYLYVLIPRFVDSLIECEPPLQSLMISLSTGTTFVPLDPNPMEVSKISSIGLEYNLTYWVYKVGATINEYTLYINTPTNSVFNLNLLSTDSAWEIIEW